MAQSRRNQRRCITRDGETPEEKWERIYGTTAFNNLPQHTRTDHDGNWWAPCPYSTYSVDQRTIDLLGSLVAKIVHQDANSRDYYMKPVYRGQWGYECTFDNCTFYLANGYRYFY